MSWIVTHFEIVLVALLVLVAAVVVLQQRRTPQSAAVWLLAIIVVPYLAIPLFLALGFRKRGSRFTAIDFSGQQAVPPGTDPRRADIVLQRFGLPAASTGNRFRLLDTPEAAQDGLLDLVASAQTGLDVLFYIVRDDPVGRGFVEALEARARDGVRVRLLLDRFGSLRPPRPALARLIEAGGEVRYFSPFIQLPAPGHFNLRNHRKIVIADGARAFSGGMNVGAEYMGPAQGVERWADLACLLDGPAVMTLRNVFRSDWAVTGGDGAALEDPPWPQDAGEATVQVVASGPDMATDPLHDVLIHAIHVATDRVWIATPYFLPTELLHNALTIAARRGVDVRILLPARSNQHLADFARGAYLRDMQEAGCKVMFYRHGMMHAKAGVVDDAAFVGSANFDIRSMLLNFEVALFVYDTGSLGKIADWFTRLEVDCVTGVAPAGLGRRVLEGAFRLGAPVL